MLKLKSIYWHPATSQHQILQDVNLEGTVGRPIIIAGASGSGKTSLVEIISGLSKPQKGKIFWNNKIISERKRRWICGVVFQFPERYFLGLTIAQELRLGHRRISGEEQSKVLSKVGLQTLDLRQAPERLSGGQQRRLAIAVQLLRKPKILILDEPTAGLDWSVRAEVMQLLEKIGEDQMIILVTHEPDLFNSWEKSYYKLNNGNLSLIK